MKMKTALLTSTSLLAMTVHAHAFSAIGNLVISGLLAVGLGGLLPAASAAAIGLGAVLTVAQLGATALNFIRMKPPSADPNKLKNTSKGAEGHGRYAFGRVMMEGKIAFGNTAGYNIHRLVLHCFGPIDAVEEYYYDGRAVTVEEDGSVSSPPFARTGGSNLYLRTKPGDGTETAWPQLKADFPTLWTDNHRVAGIGQTLLTFINPGTGSSRFPRLLTGGVKPVKILARVGRAYDPRTEETKWTRNGVLWCAHWISRLPGWSSAMLDWDDIAERADEADALVPVVGGTAPRCTLSGGWEGPLTTDIVLEMLDSAGLEVRETEEGKYTFAWLEDDPATELVMPWSREQDGIASPYIDHDLSAGPEGAKRPNVCTLEYFSPERMYEIAEGDLSGVAWAKVAHDINVYGDQERRVRLPFCDNVHQASRIARRMFYEARAESGLIKTTMAGLATWGKRVITIQVPDVGEDGEPVSLKCWKGPVRTDQADCTCEIPVTVVPAELQVPWNSATMEATPPPVLPAFEYESDLDTPAAPVEYAQVEYPDTTRELRIRFTGVTGGTIAEATRRNYSGANPNPWASMTEYLGHGGSNWYAYAGVDWEGDDADFRVRFFNSAEEGSYWSPLLSPRPVAAPNNSATGAPTIISAVATDVNDGVVLTFKAGELRAVRAVVQYDWESSGWTTHSTINPLRPDTLHTVTMDGFKNLLISDQNLNWRVATLTSNGTVGTYATGSVVIPGSGGP